MTGFDPSCPWSRNTNTFDIQLSTNRETRFSDLSSRSIHRLSLRTAWLANRKERIPAATPKGKQKHITLVGL